MVYLEDCDRDISLRTVFIESPPRSLFQSSPPRLISSILPSQILRSPRCGASTHDVTVIFALLHLLSPALLLQLSTVDSEFPFVPPFRDSLLSLFDVHDDCLIIDNCSSLRLIFSLRFALADLITCLFLDRRLLVNLQWHWAAISYLPHPVPSPYGCRYNPASCLLSPLTCIHRSASISYFLFYPFMFDPTSSRLQVRD